MGKPAKVNWAAGVRRQWERDRNETDSGKMCRLFRNVERLLAQAPGAVRKWFSFSPRQSDDLIFTSCVFGDERRITG